MKSLDQEISDWSLYVSGPSSPCSPSPDSAIDKTQMFSCHTDITNSCAQYFNFLSQETEQAIIDTYSMNAYIPFNAYSMEEPDLYYFETIKRTSQALSNFVWRIRTAGEYSLWTLTRLMKSFLWFQNSIDQAVPWNKCFIIYRTTAKNYVVCCNTAKAVKLKMHVLQLLNV